MRLRVDNPTSLHRFVTFVDYFPYVRDNAWHSRPLNFHLSAHISPLFDLRVRLSTSLSILTWSRAITYQRDLRTECSLRIGISGQEFRTPAEWRLAASMQFASSTTYFSIQNRVSRRRKVALQFRLLPMHVRLLRTHVRTKNSAFDAVHPLPIFFPFPSSQKAMFHSKGLAHPRGWKGRHKHGFISMYEEIRQFYYFISTPCERFIQKFLHAA